MCHLCIHNFIETVLKKFKLLWEVFLENINNFARYYAISIPLLNPIFQEIKTVQNKKVVVRLKCISEVCITEKRLY